jgi:hypothetical protein
MLTEGGSIALIVAPLVDDELTSLAAHSRLGKAAPPVPRDARGPQRGPYRPLTLIGRVWVAADP